jgi:hypothetical protein
MYVCMYVCMYIYIVYININRKRVNGVCHCEKSLLFSTVCATETTHPHSVAFSTILHWGILLQFADTFQSCLKWM